MTRQCLANLIGLAFFPGFGIENDENLLVGMIHEQALPSGGRTHPLAMDNAIPPSGTRP